MKILILGGYGVFGGRLANLLSDLSELELLISGRNLKSAESFCQDYTGVAKVVPLALDRKDIGQALQTHKPDLVVDASGPFQNYGANPYIVIEACIKAKIDYVDFADGTDFVFGISKYDAQAKAANIFMLSGVSTLPVLSAAVLRKLSKEIEIHSITGGIAPSPFAGLGLSVMRAIVSYAGSPIELLRDGKPYKAIALAESKRYSIAPPGLVPLRNLHFSLVDVPDLRVMPKEYETLKDIWMGAGPVPETLHRILNLLAKLRATFKLPSFEPLSPLFHRILNLAKFGEHRGGMFIHATGLKDGTPAEASWHLIAEGDDGPFIPSMAIEAIVRKLLEAERPENGARPATHALELEDYEKMFVRKTIKFGFRNGVNKDETLYRQVLGNAFETLPQQVQALHSGRGNSTWSGTASVTRGKGILSKIVAKVIGFPEEAESIPVRVEFSQDENGEKWTRDFNGKKFSSHQSCGTGKYEHLLVERFGFINVAMALVAKENRLYCITRNWNLLGIPLPKFLIPGGETFEAETDDKFNFNVEITAPIVGPIVTYKGLLEREA